MTLFRLAGFSAIRVTSQWLPGRLTPPESRARDPSQRRRRRATLRRQGLSLGLSAGLALDAADAGGARGVRRRTSPSLALQLPAVDDVIIGNEPNLNRFWLPQFNPDGTDAAAPAYLALLARSYDALKAVDPTVTRLGRCARAARRRPARHRPRHALARRIPEGHGHRLPCQRPHAPGHGRPRIPPLCRHLGPVARHASSEVDDDRPRRLRPADQTLGDGVRRYGAGGLVAPDPLRRVRRRVDGSRPESEGVHGRRAGDDASRSTRPPRGSTTGRRCSSRSASRTSSASFCSTRRTSRRSRAGSRASTTPTGRRSRASTPFAMPSPAPAAARSPVATGSGSTSRRRSCASRRRRELARGARTCGSPARSTAPGSCARRAPRTGATRARLTGYGRAGVPSSLR